MIVPVLMTETRLPRGGTAQCPNCGQPAGPEYCGRCGQRLEERHGPLGQVLGELLSEWFSLDSKLLRSLSALCRPGRLTRLYLDGKRAPYLRPFRLYLVGSLLLFSTLLTLKAPDATTVDLYVAGELIHQQSAGEPGVRSSVRVLEPDSLIGRWVAHRSPERLERFRSLPPQDVLDRFFGGLRRLMPASLILFVPFLALALKILYWRSRTLYLDHMIFALHFQSALFFALSIIWLLARLFGLGLVWSALAYALVGLSMVTVYLGLALHRLHGRSRWSTAWKTVLLFLGYLWLLSAAIGPAMLWAVWQV